MTRARGNFRAHGHIFDIGDEIDAVKDPGPARLALTEFARAYRDGQAACTPAEMRVMLNAADREFAARERKSRRG